MNEMPMVSIIVATYRREKELIRALDSLANLDYSNYEIILVDDNNDVIWNEKIKRIVRLFANVNNDVRIKHIINHSHLGSARTRNIGINNAEGEYVCFLDDDDIYLPKRIINQLNPMLNINSDYSITDLALYDDRERIVDIRKRDYIESVSYEELFEYHLMYHLTGTDTLMFKKSYLEKIKGFDPIDIGDEFYLMCKAIKEKGKFLYVPVCDVKAYVHAGNDGLSSGEKKITGENILYEYKKKYFDRLNPETIRYIKVRHNIVIAYAYFKKKEFLKVIFYLGIALMISPFLTYKIIKMHTSC